MNKLSELTLICKDYARNIFIRFYLLMQTLARGGLCIFALTRNQIHIEDIPLILANGFIADIISTFFVLPVIILLQNIKLPFVSRIFGVAASIIFVFICIFSAISQIGFWDEFNTNFNFIAVDYLIYTHEIIGTLKESMPLYQIGTMIIIVSVSLGIMVSQKSHKSAKPFIKLALAAFIAAITIGQLYNSEKFGQNNNGFAHEISKNGPYEFVYAYYNNALDYNKFYPSVASEEALNFVRDRLAAANTNFLDKDSIVRNIRGSGIINKPNIIIITVESLSAEYLTHFGSKENITPYLDKLAEDGMFFTNLYATGTRTVRGLEALTTAMPPMPGCSMLKRPGNTGIFTIGVPLREHGYQTDFIYGGYSYFDNMNNYFKGNGFEVIDRSDIPKEKISFSNIWGVADENLFDKALEVADKHHNVGEKFFSLIMTTSNHRPYNFPESRIDMKTGTRAAAVKYTDYAIGKFIEEARAKPWFKNTIFVITADHCASCAGKVQLPVNKYKIPLIIYAPNILKASVNSTLASQIDIPPTILSMTGINYRSKFFGQDIIASPPHRAFISTYQLLGYIKDETLTVLSPNAEAISYDLSGGGQKLKVPNAELMREAISYYQTAFELLIKGKLREY